MTACGREPGSGAGRRETLACLAPFAAWMILMTILPSAPWAYAARTAVVGALLLALVPGAGLGWVVGRKAGGSSDSRISSPTQEIARSLLWGVAVGVLVLAIWVWPERFAFYRRWCVFGGTANAAVDASAWYWKAFRLFGSAFVISVAEELFFRRWLLRFAGFAWMVALFAVEHDRWLVGAAAGALYGLLALRRGLLSAVVAHATTNLLLGLYVLAFDAWAFW